MDRRGSFHGARNDLDAIAAIPAQYRNLLTIYEVVPVNIEFQPSTPQTVNGNKVNVARHFYTMYPAYLKACRTIAQVPYDPAPVIENFAAPALGSEARDRGPADGNEARDRGPADDNEARDRGPADDNEAREHSTEVIAAGIRAFQMD